MILKNKHKLKFLLFLFLFLMSIHFLGNIPFQVQADSYIPEEHENNGWHWDVSEGDQLYFEADFIISNGTTFQVELMFKDIWIYNITSIGNITTDWLGVHKFSQVNATNCFYNLTAGKLEAYEEQSELALFGYNNTDSIKHRYRAGESGMPLLLPLNDSSVEVDVLDDVINESLYYPLAQMGAYNQFDYYESDPVQNKILFSNSTDGYFSEAYYYNNGTLKNGKAFLRINMDGPMFINATFKRVFDYNVTNEVEWGVEVGDEWYYDWVETSDYIEDAYDYKIEIVGISEIMLEKNKNGFGEDPVNMIFQAVYADVYLWNGVSYDLDMSNEIIAFANNFYPLYFDMSGPSFMFLFPISATLEDFEFMWNNDTIRIWETPFEEVYYSENGYIETTLVNSTDNMYVHVEVNKTDGVVESFFTKEGDFIMYYEKKSQTLVDWSVNTGDILYYKENSEFERDLKIEIDESFTVFVNMTALFLDYSSMGISVTLPTGQPELQFFSYIFAYYYEWNSSSGSWFYDTDNIFAIANTYWPISPLQFQFGPPLLMPENTDSSELTNLFSIWSPIYDDITYDSGYVFLRNSTLDRSLNFYFDETSGKVTMMYGWLAQPGPGTDWTFMSIYPKHNITCPAGANSFSQQTNFPMDISVDLDFNVSVGAPGVEYIYAILPYNPVNVSLPNGTALAYFDQLFTNSMLIDGNITMTFTLPSSIDLSSIALQFFAWNMSGNEEWNDAPPEFYDAIVYNYATNSFTIETPPWPPTSVISAISYIGGEEEEPFIPGYNLIFLLLAMIGITIVLIKRKHKNN